MTLLIALLLEWHFGLLDFAQSPVKATVILVLTIGLWGAKHRMADRLANTNAESENAAWRVLVRSGEQNEEKLDAIKDQLQKVSQTLNLVKDEIENLSDKTGELESDIHGMEAQLNRLSHRLLPEENDDPWYGKPNGPT